jgi:hypothetical protein
MGNLFILKTAKASLTKILNTIGNHTILLKEVFIKDVKSKKDLVKNSNNLNGPGNADQVLTYKDFENMGGSFVNAFYK